MAARAAAVKKAQDEFRAGRRKLMGAADYQGLRKFIKEERQRYGEALIRLGPQASDARRNQLRRQRNQRCLAFLRELGVNLKQFRAQDERMRDRMTELLEPPSRPEGRSRGPLLPHQVPKDILADTANPWTTFVPPFTNWNVGSWSLLTNGGGFEFLGFFFGNSTQQGTLGHVNQFQNLDADDYDSASAAFRSLFGFFYKTPKAGPLELWIQVQPLLAQDFLHLEDEWGESDAGTTHFKSIYCEVIGDPPEIPQPFVVTQTIDSWMKHTDEEGLHSHTGFAGQSSFWVNLKSSKNLAGGRWIWVWLGHSTGVSAWTDDMEILTTSNVKYKFQKVKIDVTG